MGTSVRGRVLARSSAEAVQVDEERVEAVAQRVGRDALLAPRMDALGA